jgi:hypothetical protein
MAAGSVLRLGASTVRWPSGMTRSPASLLTLVVMGR